MASPDQYRQQEDTLNAALGEVLRSLRRPQSWQVGSNELNRLQGGGRIDILVEDAGSWPIAIEAERENKPSAEDDAKKRLGRSVTQSGRTVESAIALVYPPSLLTLSGEALRSALRETSELEYALYTRRSDKNDPEPERLPSSGWLKGSARDLALLAHRASTPATQVDDLAEQLERGVSLAADAFTREHRLGSPRGEQLATLLGQEDDELKQTRRMAMTVLANALIYHSALASADFRVPEADSKRVVRPVAQTLQKDDLIAEWALILERNYWPIFATARELLKLMPHKTATDVLDQLWRKVRLLIEQGVTRSHDLMGTVFQRLIADRKFLATFYTRPASAALLAALAVPMSRPPGGAADWGDGEALAQIQIGDFACGTGTLLSSAYQRVSILHELHGGDPRQLHTKLMEQGLVGLDVVNTAVHFTASMLAGAHPDTPFEGECLLTMPYGKQGDGSVRIGSLELLPEAVQAGLIEDAAAVTAGGRKPENVRDLVTRVGHGKFDLVIMNPPFSRPTNPEQMSAKSPIPAYAAFNTSTADQRKIATRVVSLAQGAPSNGYAGMASHFSELADRKLHRRGTLAMVLPLSGVSGESWSGLRRRWASTSGHLIVTTIAAGRSHDTSFSADTGMAEFLITTAQYNNTTQHNTTQHNTTQHNTTQHNTTQHNTAGLLRSTHGTSQLYPARRTDCSGDSPPHHRRKHSSTRRRGIRGYATQARRRSRWTAVGLPCRQRGLGFHRSSGPSSGTDCLPLDAGSTFYLWASER